MIDMRDAEGGPLIREIGKALGEGNSELASHLAATDYMRATQFQYRRGTGPYWMQSTVGRLFGQYGTWPSYFAELGRNTLLRGSVKNRLKVIARWSATNAAMYEVAREAFGVDASRWLFFSPLGYSGGPLLQIAGQATSAVNQAVNPSEDPVAKIEAQRLKSAYQQFIPFPTGATKDFMKAMDAIQDGDYASGAKRLMGFPEIKGGRPLP
jgi:hypothetical protein